MYVCVLSALLSLCLCMWFAFVCYVCVYVLCVFTFHLDAYAFDLRFLFSVCLFLCVFLF